MDKTTPPNEPADKKCPFCGGFGVRAVVNRDCDTQEVKCQPCRGTGRLIRIAPAEPCVE